MIRFYIVPDMLANAPMCVHHLPGTRDIHTDNAFMLSRAGSSELASMVSVQREEELPSRERKVSGDTVTVQ
jgi:hypothetical protein